MSNLILISFNLIEEVNNFKKSTCKTKDLVPAVATTLRWYLVVALNPFGIVLLFEIISEELVVSANVLVPVIFCKAIVEVVLSLSIYDYFNIKILL